MKVIVHLHPREAICVWAPTFTSEHGLQFYLTYILLLFWGRCVSKCVFSLLFLRRLLSVHAYSLLWDGVSWPRMTSSSASVNGCWHTAASHAYLLTKLFRVYVQTHVREQCLASGVSKKPKPFKNSSVAKPQVRIVYHHQQTELTAFVMRNVKIK